MADFLIPNDFIQKADFKLQEDVAYRVPLTSLRVHDAVQTALGSAANDDLGISSGTLGTTGITLTAGDLKAAGATTRYGRFQFTLPPEYVDGTNVVIRAYAATATTVSDTTSTIDFQAYVTTTAGAHGSDLCATAAQSINSTTSAAKSFTITGTTLTAGMELDVRVALACNDAATATAVTPTIYRIDMLCDTRG